MRRIAIAGVTASLLTMVQLGPAAETPAAPQPTKEHQLLAQFAGQWKSRAETMPAPGQVPIVCEGTETARMLGGYWLVAEGQGDMLGQPVTSLLTIGYDPAKQKYVGTFICSVAADLWQYEGAMDPSGKKLTLHAEGPSMLDPTKPAKYREVLELKDADHKTFTSFMETDEGKWQPIVTVTYERVK
ncbi:MAG: hypothetical protein DCC67_00845 [Planctomycetota bacterium]|nr:MAG: hypothetical protein DCC67_00845 [Planctomycetota bacterium]